MGIVNVTPDSFSDGGQFTEPESALRHALLLVEQGADILDIGGESTRPGARKVSEQQELDRVLPVIELISRETGTLISIDTHKPVVMREAVQAGASMINDINGLRTEGAIEAAVQCAVPVCIMHMQGKPENMQAAPTYSNVTIEVQRFFNERVMLCLSKGLCESDLILDPGIGFGKTLEHNLALLNALPTFLQKFAGHLLIGVSRKSMIDKLLGRHVGERLPASLALAVQAVLNGAKIVRVHDVRETYDAIKSVEAVAHVQS
jgi:dihydropteroate synthase